ncbi:MAG: non-canonical purine NTP pyrophosphatase [Candidatus Limnocylindrales bacterium]
MTGRTSGSADRARVLVATRSAHKLRELRELLGLRAELIDLDDAGILDEATEDGATFEANAAKKARFFALRSGLPTLADDSGLEVDALGGGPGVRTRRYAGENATDEENNVKLLAALDGLEPARRRARYRCVLALALPEELGPRGGLPIRFARGTLEGRIAGAPKGDGGFGYDPIFEPAGERPGGRTLGLWTAEAKNRISHRGRAARRMHRCLVDLGF